MPIRNEKQNIEEIFETVESSGKDIENIFKDISDTISDNLEKAAKSGELSFKKLSQKIKKDFQELFIEKLVKKPVEGFLSKLFNVSQEGDEEEGGSKFFNFSQKGGRAAGGFVAPSQPYLVGENGPELFSPSSSGHISPQNSGSVININLNLHGVTDFQSFNQSKAQIANIMQQAISKGNRNN